MGNTHKQPLTQPHERNDEENEKTEQISCKTADANTSDETKQKGKEKAQRRRRETKDGEGCDKERRPEASDLATRRECQLLTN